MTEPRLLTKSEAAAYCRCSLSAFDDWIRRGIMPSSIPGTHRWDRKAIDKDHPFVERAPARSAAPG